MGGRHKTVVCNICHRSMLNANLKRHRKIHERAQLETSGEMLDSVDMERSFEDIKRRKVVSFNQQSELEKDYTGSLEEDMLFEHRRFVEKIEMGKEISMILDKGEVLEQSLSRERQHALDLYRKSIPRVNVSSIELWSWQSQAFTLVEQSTERQVIWITGTQGGEGKSVLQRYIEAFYGLRRVFCADLRIKHANMCNILKKRTLATVDIFLFNDARSVIGGDIDMYRILEDIKDGQATTSKYNNDNIRFKVPNVVMVFSNGYPDTKKLSRDRLKIYNATKNGVNDVTERKLGEKRT